MIATIRVVNIEEAKTAIAMLQAYLAAHGEDLATETPAPKTVTKAKPAPKTEKVSEPVKETKVVKKAPVVKKEVLATDEETSSALSLAAITAKAKEVRGKTSTSDVKEAIAKFTTGKLSTIKEEDYEAFVDALDALVA